LSFIMYKELLEPIPILHTNSNKMSIPKYGIYNFVIPPAKFYKSKKFRNGFIMFRAHIQKIFGISVEHSSHIASKIWKASDQEFKDLFDNIARETREASLQAGTEFEFKEVNFQTKKKKPRTKVKLNKPPPIKPIKREKFTRVLFQNEVDCFEF